MERKPILVNRVLIASAVFFSFVFASTMASRAIIAQNDTEREIEKINMESRMQCRQWIDENGEKVLKVRKEDINCTWKTDSFREI
jgi:hypothetical protein